MSSTTSIHWFRRDLRLTDNKGLYQACQSDHKILPVFIFDSNILDRLKDKNDKRIQIIFDGVMELKENLLQKGSDLLILHGDPLKLIPNLAAEINAQAVFANEDYEPYAMARDRKILKKLKEKEVNFLTFKDHLIFAGNEVLKKDQTPYKVFTPYKNEWRRRLLPEHLASYSSYFKKLMSKNSFPKPQVKNLADIGFLSSSTIKGGEKMAKRVFKSFLKRIHLYHQQRDDIPLNTNSSISPYLRFGMISIRELVRKVYFLEDEGAKVWLSEIIWREFYQMIMTQFPHVIGSSFKTKYAAIKWPGTKAHFDKWVAGETGYPLIDAAMIHFANTGIMHNRLRMVVASFLVKDLLVDWKKGEEYFATKLLDFDLASNNGGWQWCASTGCDAQPYFRIFNPITQSKKFDPDGDFIKSHIPILKNFNSRDIHFPANSHNDKQIAAQCVIGRDYPKPIVDHATQRERAIRLLK